MNPDLWSLKMRSVGDGQAQPSDNAGPSRVLMDRRDSSGDRRSGSADRRSGSVVAAPTPLRPAEIHDACCEWSVPAEKPSNVGASPAWRHGPRADRRS